MSGEDLSDAALEAINEALNDWEQQRENGMPSADDVDEDALFGELLGEIGR